MNFQLPPHFTLARLAEGLGPLTAAADEADLTLDASEVVQIDTAGLQALLAVARRRKARGLTLKWTSSQPLDAMARAAGLAVELGLAPGGA
ncbi:MAG: STAS domain-containing protein [Myxococcota bacterium]